MLLLENLGKVNLHNIRSLNFSGRGAFSCMKKNMYLQFMSVQYFHRLSCAHALRKPGDVQEVNRSLAAVRVQPLPDLRGAVVFRYDVCDTLTATRQVIALQQS